MAANKGQALIELIVAITITITFLVALTTGIIAAREGLASSGKSFEANILLQKEIEALRSVKEGAWDSISSPGTYHIIQSGNNWSVKSETIVEGAYTRGFTVTNVCRTGTTSQTEDCTNPEAIVDPSTKEVVASVSWSFIGTRSTSSTFYLSRYSGNQVWIQTTQADFKAGTHDNTKDDRKNGGAVKLDQTGGTQEFTERYESSGDYIFDQNKIEVVGGYAQLKTLGGSPVSGQTTNPGFNSESSNWSFSSWGDTISQTGNYQSSSGNPGGYVNINFPAQKKKKSGGYWYQAFTTTAANPTATLTFDWRTPTYDPKPKSFRLYAFVDTGSGAPNIANNVWDSGDISGTTSWSSTVTVNVSTKLSVPGTYYLKVVAFVDYGNKNKGPFIAAYDNVNLSWSGTIGGSYPDDSPTIHRNTSFSASSITSWESFTETAQTNGGSIRYQLSDDDGTTWKYYNGSAWVTTNGPTDYNDAGTINTQINIFPTANNQINVKAFLISDGSQHVRLDIVTIGFTGSSTGTFFSTSFDAGNNVSFNRLFWAGVNTATTTTSLQIAVNTDDSTWNFVGPDGTSNTFFTGGSGVIPLNLVSGRYVSYKIIFTSTDNNKPLVEAVTINYSP